MTMQTDVKSASILQGESLVGRTRLKAVLISYTATAGAVVLSEVTTGAVKFSFTTPAVAGSEYVLIPGEGILFESGITATTITNCTVTAFHG